MLLGLGTSIALGLGVRAVWGKKANTASFAAVATGAIMYGVFDMKLRSMEEKISNEEII